jgi:hypothetical protein
MATPVRPTGQGHEFSKLYGASDGVSGNLKTQLAQCGHEGKIAGNGCFTGWGHEANGSTIEARKIEPDRNFFIDAGDENSRPHK